MQNDTTPTLRINLSILRTKMTKLKEKGGIYKITHFLNLDVD